MFVREGRRVAVECSKSSNPIARRATMVAAAVASLAGVASAANYGWDANGSAAGSGGTGTWNTSSALWTPDGTTYVAWPAGNTAVFGGTAGTVTASGALSVGGLTFDVGGYTLAGSSITLANGSVIKTSGGTTTINTTLIAAGGASVTKTGSGTLNLTGTGNGGFGSAASPATWTVTGGAFANGTFDSAIAINFGSNLGAAPTSATTQLILDAGALNVLAAGSPTFGAGRQIQVNAAGGAIVDSSGASNSYQGPIVNNAGAASSLYFSNAAAANVSTLSGVVSGSGSLTFNGAGTLALTGTNTFTGGTVVNGGTVRFVNDANLGASTSAVTLNGGTLESKQTAGVTLTHAIKVGAGGGTIALNGGASTAGANKITIGGTDRITGNGALTVKNTGQLSVGGNNANFGGNWTLNGGVTEFTSNTAAGTGAITVNGGATLSTLGSQINNALTLNGGTIGWDFFSGSGDYRGPVTLAAGGGTVGLSNFYGSGAMSGTVSGNVSGSGALATSATNTGNTTFGGTLTLGGTANNYAGGTTVGVGTTLRLAAGSSVGSGALSVAGTFDTGGNALSQSAFNGQGGSVRFALGAAGAPNTLTVATASSAGTTGIAIDTSAAASIAPGTYTLIRSTGGGLGGAVTFAGGQQLSVPATTSIQKVNGTNVKLTLTSADDAVSVTVSAAPSKVISILPLGSSITAGQSAASPYTGGGYRTQLYQDLVNDGRFAPQMVGKTTTTLANNPAGLDLLTAVGQNRHEGHPGYTTTQTLANLDGNDNSGGNSGGFWLAPGNGVEPDYVTLNVGGNDFFANPADATAIDRLDQILTKVHELRPNATVVVSTILTRTDGNGAYANGFNTLYNPKIAGLVYRHALAGEHVQFLDLAAQFTAAELSSDGVHPTQATYNKMADLWYDAIVTGQAYFTGAQGPSWSATNGTATSWAMNFQRDTDRNAAPDAGTDVYFNGGGAGATTLGADFAVRSVNFTSGATDAVTIGGANTLTIGAGGITVQAGTGAHAIAAKVALSGAQTWSNVSTNRFTVSGVIGGNGPLTIGGTGTIALTGANTFTGGLSVEAGATLAGDGSIASPTLLAGTVAPSDAGGGPATFAFAGGLVNDGTVALDLFGGASDRLDVGTFDVGTGEVIVAANGVAFAPGQSWDLIDWQSKAGTLSAANVVLPALSGDLAWDTSRLDSAGVVSIVSTAVPEPAVAGVVAAGTVALAQRRRRR